MATLRLACFSRPFFPPTQCWAVCVERAVYFCSAWKIECEQIGRSRQRSRQRQTARLALAPRAKMLFIHARAACESFAHLRALSPLAGVFNLSVPRAPRPRFLCQKLQYCVRQKGCWLMWTHAKQMRGC